MDSHVSNFKLQRTCNNYLFSLQTMCAWGTKPTKKKNKKKEQARSTEVELKNDRQGINTLKFYNSVIY